MCLLKMVQQEGTWSALAKKSLIKTTSHVNFIGTKGERGVK